MRQSYRFNHHWQFAPQQVPAETPDSLFQDVILPHSNIILPHNHFDDAAYQFRSTYRKRFRLPQALHGRRLYVEFAGAMTAASVSINGHHFPEQRGGYVPFCYDLTDFVDENVENTLLLHLDSSEREDIPPFGYVVDYLTFGGLYRDVTLHLLPALHIHNARVLAFDVLSDSPRLEVDVFLRNQTDAWQTLTLSAQLAKDGQALAQSQAPEPVSIAPRSEATVRVSLSEVPRLLLWSPDAPQLYTVQVRLGAEDALYNDAITLTTGFREAVFKDDGFYLNGERLFLRGLNRHQTYPFIGAAAPARLQRLDADILKYDLGCNIVRTSHYPQSVHFLQRCDEIGLLVLEEIPGWQHIGDADWQALSLRDVRAMIQRDWNHPSIILWGVRINESQDSEAFYTLTNAAARTLDPTRQTTGTRYFAESQQLEDVFGYNDFSNGVIEPSQSPWLITEFNGHMFPTKTWDGEERRVEHAIRHARIQAQASSMGGVSGAIGWCAFDYNTHKEFGSGDRVCYHGVMDLYRLPKFAAYAYASQIDPAEKIVLQAATRWSMGDRSAGGNNPLTVFSNVEEIDVYVGAEHHGTYLPDAQHYPTLPHPPFTVGGLFMRWGDAYGDLRIIGKIGGVPVAEQWIVCDAQPAQLILRADHTELVADGVDMTRLVFMIADAQGLPLPYCNKVVAFGIDGPADLIGENPFALIGGQAALWVRSRPQAGQVVIRAVAARLPAASVQLTMLAPEGDLL